MAGPANKRKILKESITRLLQLGIAEKDILENLKSVGVDESLGKEILIETKAELSGARPKADEKTAKPEPSQPSAPQQGAPAEKKQAKKRGGKEEDNSPEGIIESVYSGEDDGQDEEEPGEGGEEIADEAGGEADFSAGSAPKIASIPKDSGQRPVEVSQIPGSIQDSGELSGLWQNGIIATVDSRLAEMKKIRDELDLLIERKISEKMKLEAKKVETVLDSQRQLFYGKIDIYLESKAEDLKKVLEARAKQLEDANARVQGEVGKIQSEKKFNSEILTTLNEKLSGIDTLRSQIISEVNQSLIVHETKFNEMMDQSVKKRNELESRITRSLQLESKITEGLLEDAKNRIESMRLTKEEELEKRVMEKVAQLDSLAKQVDPKGILDALEKIKKLDERVSSKVGQIDPAIEVKTTELSGKLDSHFGLFRQEFSEFKDSISKLQDSRFVELRQEYADSLDELFSQQLLAWDARLKDKERQIEELEAKVDIEKVNATIDSLDLFKTQFVNTISKSIDDYNKTKKELAQSIISRDKAINEYLEKIDSKMKELGDFQKKFSIEVSGLLDRVPDLPAATKEKKSKQKE